MQKISVSEGAVSKILEDSCKLDNSVASWSEDVKDTEGREYRTEVDKEVVMDN